MNSGWGREPMRPPFPTSPPRGYGPGAGGYPEMRVGTRLRGGGAPLQHSLLRHLGSRWGGGHHERHHRWGGPLGTEASGGRGFPESPWGLAGWALGSVPCVPNVGQAPPPDASGQEGAVGSLFFCPQSLLFREGSGQQGTVCGLVAGRGDVSPPPPL